MVTHMPPNLNTDEIRLTKLLIELN